MSFSLLKGIRDTKKSRNTQPKHEWYQSIKTDLEVTEMLKLAGKATKTVFINICHLFASGDMYD